MGGGKQGRRPKHAKPERFVSRLREWTSKPLAFISAAAVGVVGTLMAAWIGGFGPFVKTEAEQTFDVERAIEELRAAQDASLESPVSVTASMPDSLRGWVSDRVLEFNEDQCVKNAGNCPQGSYPFPGNDVAFRAGYPVKDYFTTEVLFELTGNTHRPVIVSSMHAVIDEYGKPFTGTVVQMQPGGADNLRKELLFPMFGTLDAGDKVEALNERAIPYVEGNSISIARDETIGYRATINFPAYTMIAFHIEVEFSTGQKTIVQDSGRPFYAVAFPESAQRTYHTN